MSVKVAEYLAFGVVEVWAIDPQARELVRFRGDAAPEVLAADNTLASETVLPGFSCRVADLFRDA